MSLLKRAVDPSQYDLDDLAWSDEVLAPIHEFFFEPIANHSALWVGATVLDIGCGSGWLLDRIKKGGAAYVEGCEPSQNNIDLGQKLHPDIIIHKATLESFTPTMQYDLITAVMVFGHIGDLDSAFTKLYSMLKPGGQFHIVTHDYDYNKMKRYKYDVQIEELNEDSYVTMTKRKFGSIADIVRKVKMLKEAAEKAGLTFIEDIPMYPTERLMKTAPHYEASRNVVLTHFLRFKSEK